MSLTILTGKISHVDHATAVTGAGSVRGGHGNMMVRTTHVWSFRLNNHPVTYKGLTTASFGEGDELTAAGQEKNGTFVIESCRNETTGAVYERPATKLCVLSAFLIVMGLALTVVLVGILVLPFGGYFLWTGLKYLKANKLLRAAPRPALAPSAG
jgi:hypothetical protein